MSRDRSSDVTPISPAEFGEAFACLSARGTILASRVAVGEQCSYGIDVRGTEGALSWDFRRMGELRVCLAPDYQDATWETRLVGPGDGELAAFQPGSGMAMGFDDLKVVEAKKFLVAVTGGEQHNSTIAEALADAEVIAAAAASAVDGQWHRVTEVPGATFGHPHSVVPAHV